MVTGDDTKFEKEKLLGVLRGTAESCDKCGSYRVRDDLQNSFDLSVFPGCMGKTSSKCYKMSHIICEECDADYTVINLISFDEYQRLRQDAKGKKQQKTKKG